MRDLFIKQLETTKIELHGMFEALMYMLESTKKVIETYDYQLAKEVIEADLAIDHYETAIESACFSLLLRQQPVASDLKFIESTLKVIRDNERIGDYSSNVCESLLEIREIPITISKELSDMLKEEMRMLAQIETFMETNDVKLLDEVIDNDDILDEHYAHIKELVIHYIAGQEDVVADSILMGRSLERIGDHLVNIANNYKA